MSWFLPLATGLGVPEVVLKRSPPKPDLWKEFPRRNLVHNFFVGLPWGLLCRRPYLKEICRSSAVYFFFFFLFETIRVGANILFCVKRNIRATAVEDSTSI